jgi:multidrug efflux pump subunit AcrB
VTTVVVFFPVLFLTGVARNLFTPLALTIAFALFLSFIVSRTVTPLLCLRVLKTGLQPRGPLGAIARTLDRLGDVYAVALRWVLRHRALVITGIVALFGGSLLIGRGIGTEFFPKTDEAQFSVIFKMPVGTRVERTSDLARSFESRIQRMFGRESRVMIAMCGIPGGRGGMFSPNSGPHAGMVQVNLVPSTERAESDVEAMERLRKSLAGAMPGVQAFYSTGGVVQRTLNFGSTAPIDVEILGYDLEQGSTLAREVRGRLRELTDARGQPLLANVDISREENYPQLDVRVDRQKAGVLGLSEQQIAQTVLASLSGNNQFSPILYTDPTTGNLYNVNVRLADRHRAQVADLSDLFLRTPAGAMVALDSVATVERNSGPVAISRKYMQRIIDVTADVAPTTDLGTAAAATQEALNGIVVPEGFDVRLGGQVAAQREAFAGLGFAALMALALVYMVLASQFKSLLDPLVIMFSVPMGISGVLLMLWATGTPLSVNSFMGIIMMVGIVVSNGVLLVDFANTLRARGKPLLEATVEAGRTRLRPILMTTIATLAALAPMAIGIGEGSETNLPLARAVIGGLSVSTVFTLFLVPALYSLLSRYKKIDPTMALASSLGIASAPETEGVDA